MYTRRLTAVLPFNTLPQNVCTQGLQLDALIPKCAEAALPNLRRLRLVACRFGPGAPPTATVNLACGNLQHVEVAGLEGTAPHCSLQLMQLVGLPALTSFTLRDTSCPTLFLNALSHRLTELHLGAALRRGAPAWRATMHHVACCTALQSLTIPCATSEELGLVAPALQQLRQLHLTGPGANAAGDAVVERLLALPHLTSLRWDAVHAHAFQRSHATRAACRWKELGFGLVGPHQLARLPLHSLTSPVSWETLVVDQHTSVAEVRVAADNAARYCPQGCAGGGGGCWPTLDFLAPAGLGGAFTQGAGEGDTPAALLRALRPPLAGLSRLVVSGLAWDAGLVRALGEALPRTCVRLGLRWGSVMDDAGAQLALSLPWVQELWLHGTHVRPRCISAALCAASALGSPVSALRLVSVKARSPPLGSGEAAWAEGWEGVRRVARALSLAVEVVDEP